MARAFAGLAGRGRLPEVMPLRYVLNSDGECLQRFRKVKGQKCEKKSKPKHERAIDENSVDVLTRTLTGVVTGGTATAANIGRPVAGKTGTTQDHRDAWFAGYTPQLATVVWMGYPIEKGPDGKVGSADDFVPLMHYCSNPRRCRPVDGIEVTGGSFPADIWAAYMSRVMDAFDVAYFVDPVDEPDQILNEAPPPPPPPAKEKRRERDGDGDGGGGVAADERADVGAGVERLVGAIAEEVRAAGAEVEQLPGRKEFDAAVLPRPEQRGGLRAFHGAQQVGAARVVDGAAVVGIDEAEVP
jgi:membrane peptidoglycan carboxypeptidase